MQKDQTSHRDERQTIRRQVIANKLSNSKERAAQALAKHGFGDPNETTFINSNDESSVLVRRAYDSGEKASDEGGGEQRLLRSKLTDSIDVGFSRHEQTLDLAEKDLKQSPDLV